MLTDTRRGFRASGSRTLFVRAPTSPPSGTRPGYRPAGIEVPVPWPDGTDVTPRLLSHMRQSPDARRRTFATVWEDVAMDVSACNRIEGRIADLKKGKATTNVRIDTKLGEITAVVTSSAVEALQLEAGDRVSALFREVDVMLMTGGGAISTRNRFPGRILDVKKGGVTAELVLDVGGGARIIAAVARTAAEEMGL